MCDVRILAVDDDANQLAALRRILRRSHFDVTTATSGKKGLRLARENPPDLVLLDVSMPAMSGFEFLRRFRRLGTVGPTGTDGGTSGNSFEGIPVIVVTALGASHQRVDGLNAGVADYITKPYDADELRARIRSQLRRARRETERLTLARSQLAQMGTTIGRMRQAARACGQPLLDLNTHLELAECVRRPQLRSDLLARARRNLGRLTRSLLHVAEGPAMPGGQL